MEEKNVKKDIRDTWTNRTWWKVLKWLLVGAQAVTAVMLIVSLLQTNIISGPILGLAIGGLILLLVINVVELLMRKRTTVAAQVLCAICAVLSIVASSFALTYTGAFNGFVGKVTERKPEMKEYSVIVANKSNYQGVNDLNQKNIGFLETDPKAGNAEQKLKEIVAFEASSYADMDTLLGALSSTLSDAVVLESSRTDVLKESEKNPLADTRVIYTFEIELESADVEIMKKAVTEEPFIVYISGSDSRHGVQATARSDVNIVAVVNPKEAKILLVSIPRDTYVQLHGTVGLKDKLTHAGVYGIEMSKTTIEDFLNVDINYTIKVSFDTVVKVVDQLDGIDINSDLAMELKAENGKVCKYVVGKQHLDGDCALRFARERKSYETGDRHRGENQQQVITSIIDKMSSSRDYILKLPTILNIAADSFETSLSREEITDFIRLQLQKQPKWQVKSIAVDGTGTMLPTYSMGANLPLYVMIPNEATVVEARNQIEEYMTVTPIDNNAENSADNTTEVDNT